MTTSGSSESLTACKLTAIAQKEEKKKKKKKKGIVRPSHRRARVSARVFRQV